MSDVTAADQIRALHAEAVAAIAQRRKLAVEARSALIAALRNRLICRPGCEDALATWGLEPLPHRWAVTAEAHLSYTRAHTDLAEAREQARFGVPEEVRLLQPALAVYPRHVIDVAPAPGGGDQQGPQPYRITVEVTLQTWVTATREAHAHDAARAIVEGHQAALASAGITLTGLTWHAAHRRDEIPLDDVDTDAQPAAGRAQPADAGDLATAAAARDAAVQALADLQRSIRARAIRALIDDEIGGIYQHTAQRVDQFLVGLGLDPLPRAHHVTVVADLTLPIPADTAGEACEAARDTMCTATTDSPDETRPWTAYGWTIPEYAACGHDGWRIPWRHEYDMWLRGHTTPADASAAAERLVRADLARAVPDVDNHLVTVTTTVQGVGIDLYLHPDRD